MLVASAKSTKINPKMPPYNDQREKVPMEPTKTIKLISFGFFIEITIAHPTNVNVTPIIPKINVPMSITTTFSSPVAMPCVWNFGSILSPSAESYLLSEWEPVASPLLSSSSYFVHYVVLGLKNIPCMI